MPRRRLTAIFALVTAAIMSVVAACVFFHDDLLFMWDEFSCPVPQDFVDKRIGRMVKNQRCSSRELSLFEDYCTHSGVGGLYAYGEMWSLFVDDPEMIRIVHAADSTGRVAYRILHNGPSCYLEYRSQIPHELSARASALYHQNLPNYLPDAAGLREEWARVLADQRLSTHPASQDAN